MASLVYSLSQSKVTNQEINFDEFLAKNIHSHLINFHIEITLRYPDSTATVQKKWNELKKMDLDLLTDTLNL